MGAWTLVQGDSEGKKRVSDTRNQFQVLWKSSI